MAALDQFAQALGPLLSQPSPLGRSLPRDPGPAPAQALRNGGGDGARERGGDPVLPSPRPPIAPSPLHPYSLPPATHPAAVKAAGPEKSQPVATRRDGITRKGTRGDWSRRVRLAVLALTIGLGFSRVVRATERAGESYQRQEMGKSVAGRCAPRAHPSPHRTAPR